MISANYARKPDIAWVIHEADSLSFELGWGKKHLTEDMLFEERLERDKSTGCEEMAQTFSMQQEYVPARAKVWQGPKPHKKITKVW